MNLKLVAIALALSSAPAFGQGAICRVCDSPNGAAAGAAKFRRAGEPAPIIHGETHAPPPKRPYFDPAWIRRGVAAGMISQAQMVWYLRYNAGEDPGPFPHYDPWARSTAPAEPAPTVHCTTSWAPIGINGEWQTECR